MCGDSARGGGMREMEWKGEIKGGGAEGEGARRGLAFLHNVTSSLKHSEHVNRQ